MIALRKHLTCTIAAGVLSVVGLAIGMAQNRLDPPEPAFEVESIKPNTSGERAMEFGITGDRLTVSNIWLLFLIREAYNVKIFQISGGPSWIKSDRFDISAKADSPLSINQTRLMLQSLLRTRFQLVVHREARELPIYTLTAAKGGLKLQESKAGKCIPPDPNVPPTTPPGPISTDTCGFDSISPRGIDATGISMAQLATDLSNIVQRTVIDKTGLSGTFDVHVEWAADQATPGMFPPGAGPGPAANMADANGPSIFTALQDQLGIKLESDKGPVEMIVIDNVEKPSEN